MTPKALLHIGDELSLPLDAVTQTFAILGIRGSGKTNTAVVMFEEMVKQGDQCVVLDPTDAWYGVRSSHDGKSPGLEVYVFGGEHGDLPLEGTHGAQMADFVIESGASVVFSLRHLSMADQRKFAADFGERLRFLKAKPENRNPLQLFLDEAEEFVPQNIRESDPNTSRMFGAFNRIVRRDRNLGLGITLISQRPQSVNKEPLSQIETLVCHRLLHKLDRKAVKESWIDGHDTAGIGEKFLDSLSSLEKGDVWVWSPYWLDLFKRVHIRHRETFDSSATPKTGQVAKVAKVRAQVDLDVLRQKLSETIDKARSNDPTYLKRRILELEKAVREAPKKVEPIDSTQLDKAYEAGRRDLLAQVRTIKTQLEASASRFSAEAANLSLQKLPEFFSTVFTRIQELASKLPPEATPALVPTSIAGPGVEPRRSTPTSKPAMAMPTSKTSALRPAVPTNGNGDLSGPERKILTALAELRSIGKEMPPKTMVAAWSSYSPQGGAFGNPMGALSSKGYVEYPQPGFVVLTDAGRAAIGDADAPDQEEIWRRIERTCTGPERKILRALIDHAGAGEISKVELAEKAGYSPVGGAFGNPIGALRTKGLLDYPRQGIVRAADWLFLN